MDEDPKKLQVNTWNSLIEFQSGKWDIVFFFNHPTFMKTEENKYVVYTSSTFGFSMVERDLKFIKGTKRLTYTLAFKEAIRMCFLETDTEDSVEFSRPIVNATNVIESFAKRYIRVKATPNLTTFTMFESENMMQEVRNAQKFSLATNEFKFLCELIKSSATQQTGMDATFSMHNRRELTNTARHASQLQDQLSTYKQSSIQYFNV